MACSARCVVVLMIAVDIQRCRIRFRFADHGYVTVRVDTAVSPRSASLCCSFLIYGCASRARLCRWGIALLIAVDIQRGQKFIRFANHGRYTALVDTAVSSRRALACSSLLIHDWACCIFALPICYVAVGIYTLHGLLCQMHFYFTDRSEYTAMPDMLSLC